MAVPPFLIGVAGDADEGAGVLDGFALGEVAEEVALAPLAFLFARVGPGAIRGFSISGFHEVSPCLAGSASAGRCFEAIVRIRRPEIGRVRC